MTKILESIIKRRKGSIFVLFLLVAFFVPGGTSSQGQMGERENDLVSITSSFTMNFSTYLGGNISDYGKSITTALDGSIYIIGSTDSADFPTKNAYNNTYGGNCDVFITKFSSTGSLLWSTFLGGYGYDGGTMFEDSLGIATGIDGSCYVTGFTQSSNFPILNAYDSTFSGGMDAFIAKFNADGMLLWSTYLGGSSFEGCHDIAVANDGSCYVTGYTLSDDFPTLNAYNSTFGGGYGDAFVVKFSTTGSLLWSTFLGGNEEDYGKGIAVSSDGSCYGIGVTYSTNFPVLNAFDSSYNGGAFNFGDAYIVKFSSSGTLLWSTYLGGSTSDGGLAIAVTSDGICYITGTTNSEDFPTANAYNNALVGGFDSFITKFAMNGSLLWSTYFGGEHDDIGCGISVLSDDSCLVTGVTGSDDFPTLNAYDNSLNNGDAFIAEFSNSGFLRWSTYLGGDSGEIGYSIASDGSSCYVTGVTDSTNFPTLNAYNSTLSGIYWYDAFVTKFDVLEDELEPTISATTYNPTPPTNEDNITIGCIVTDESGIQMVTLYYNVNNASWISKEMKKGAANYYSTKIGPFEVGDIIKYYIEAVDDSPNHNIAVNDNNGEFFEIIIQKPTGRFSGYGFLTCIIVMPILVLLLRKRRK